MSQSSSLHVAIVMDGNGRWARRRGLPRVAGRRAGAEAVRRTVATHLADDDPFLVAADPDFPQVELALRGAKVLPLLQVHPVSGKIEGDDVPRQK